MSGSRRTADPARGSTDSPQAERPGGLLGTCVGIFTIVVGVGPRTPFDLALHAAFVAALVTGLAFVARGHDLPAPSA